jgi:hypothetical protein
MSFAKKKGKNRKAVVTLGVNSVIDDPSILQACVAALKGGPVDGVPISPAPPSPPSNPSAKRVAVSDDVQKLADDAIDSSLKQVLAELRKSGVEPKFDGAAWGDRLVELCTVLKQLEAAGFKIEAEEGL